jgi:protein TonB
LRYLVIAASLLGILQTSEVPADFAVRYQSKSCPFETIDLFKGTSERYEIFPRSIALTDRERADLFRAVNEAHLFELTTGVQPEGALAGGEIFEIEVQSEGARHTERWRAETGSAASETGVRLMQLRQVIRDVVLGRPEIASLHPDEGDCPAGQALAGRSTATPAPPPVVGDRLFRPQRTKSVAPAYPPSAAAAHVEGIVLVEAIIGKDGKIRDAMVLRSIPLLDQAALDAVWQWEFAPAVMYGNPVPLVMTVAVKFPP